MIFEILIMLTAIPIGYLIVKAANDELKFGKPWFRILIVVSILGGIWFWLTNQREIAWTSAYIFIVSLISFVRSP